MNRAFPPEPAELATVRATSRRIGTDLSLVQGSGGNTSFKNGNVLWVKASGTWLSEAEDRNIMVPLDLNKVRSIASSGGSDFGDAMLSGQLRPSIETSLHCQLPHSVVLHVHSVSGIAWSVRKNSRSILNEVLAGLNWRYVPYAKPGTSLTAAVFNVLTSDGDTPDLLMLENHGLVVGGESCDLVERLLFDVEKRLTLTARSTPVPKIVSLQKAVSELVGWRLPATHDIHDIALDEEALGIAIGGALIPDHAVFLDKQVAISGSADEILATLSEYRNAFIDDPDWMIVKGAGVILSSRLGSAGEAQLRGLSAIALRVPSGSVVRYIDENAVANLKNWDAEIYRKKLDKERSQRD